MINNKIHIAFVIHDANPVPYFNWFAAKAVNSDRYTFSFIFLNEDISKIQSRMSQYGFPIHWIQFDNNNKKRALIYAFRKLYFLLKKIKPDILHSHLFYDGVIALTAAKWAGIKIRIQTKQSTGFNWYYAPKAVRFDKMKNRLATHLIAVSGECRDFVIQKEKANPSKVYLVNHGVDVNETTLATNEQMEFIRKKYNPENKLMVMMVARYIDWKGYIYFIKAAVEVLKKNENIIFLGIGTGPQLTELQKLINELGIEKNFILTGFIQRDLIPAVYQAGDFYVHTAFREPFGFVIAEAMLNGLPMVTTPTGAAGDAIRHLENGYLVDYHNVEQLIEGINYLAALSPSERKEIGNKAKMTAEKMFSFDNMWKGYTEIYEEAIAKLK